MYPPPLLTSTGTRNPSTASLQHILECVHSYTRPRRSQSWYLDVLEHVIGDTIPGSKAVCDKVSNNHAFYCCRLTSMEKHDFAITPRVATSSRGSIMRPGAHQSARRNYVSFGCRVQVLALQFFSDNTFDRNSIHRQFISQFSVVY
jgi:hypothetical protein